MWKQIGSRPIRSTVERGRRAVKLRSPLWTTQGQSSSSNNSVARGARTRGRQASEQTRASGIMAAMAAAQTVAAALLPCQQTGRVGVQGSSIASSSKLGIQNSRFAGGKLAHKGASNGSRISCRAALTIPKDREALLVRSPELATS